MQPLSIETRIWHDSVATNLFREIQHQPTGTPSLSDLMYLRFGFIEGPNGLDIDPPHLNWIEVLCTFGHMDREPDPDVKVLPFAVIEYLEPIGRQIVEKTCNVSRQPINMKDIRLPSHNIWDLNDKHMHPLSNITSLHITMVTLDKKPFYELEVSQCKESTWRLVVCDAATAVFGMCSRWGEKALECVTMHLVELGIPFQC